MFFSVGKESKIININWEQFFLYTTDYFHQLGEQSLLTIEYCI